MVLCHMSIRLKYGVAFILSRSKKKFDPKVNSSLLLRKQTLIVKFPAEMFLASNI